MNVRYFMKATRYTALAANREGKRLFRSNRIDVDPPSAAIEANVAVDEHQNFAEGRCLARIDLKKIDIHRVAFRDAVLPSASLNDCVGHKCFPGRKSRANSHRTTPLANR